MRPPIHAENLSKRFRIGARREEWHYDTLRDTISVGMKRGVAAVRAGFRRRTSSSDAERPDHIWGLKDVSFEVKPGEVVGVLGRNGAGKSTLLKILSRITEPTAGYVDIVGRVGSLLEVGMGFHNELTGRENVYLSGAILGMTKAEIDRKFERIVAFSEVGMFIDTPTKHYSTGMFMRLAFAVAAHLEPDILLVDEVLAVGDLAFQRKCVSRIKSVARQGSTVLFVSHNVATVKELCDSALVLQDGRLAFRGPIKEGVAAYTRILGGDDVEVAPSGSGVEWLQVSINGTMPGVAVASLPGEPFYAEAILHVRDGFTTGNVSCQVSSATGDTLVRHIASHDSLGLRHFRAGRYVLRVEFPGLWLVPGVYTVHFILTDPGVRERYDSDRALMNVTGGADGNSGTLAPNLKWTLADVGSSSST